MPQTLVAAALLDSGGNLCLSCAGVFSLVADKISVCLSDGTAASCPRLPGDGNALLIIAHSPSAKPWCWEKVLRVHRKEGTFLQSEQL